MSSHYSRVPKDLPGNLRYRAELLKWADTKAKQRSLIEACRDDILFFFNVFAWLYEPRSSRLVGGGTSNYIPFITYPYQDDAFLEMLSKLGKDDIGIEKSRDLGATWMVLALFFHQWLFVPGSSFGVMSRTEDLVDRTGKKATLMWKLDFLLRGESNKFGLPEWMRPEYNRVKMNLVNLSNGSSIEGASTTEDAFRGDRKKAIMMDEYAAFDVTDSYNVLAASQHATDCRIFVSTPKGAAGAYYDVMHDPHSNIHKIVLSWEQHPDRKHGLYTSKNHQLEIIDKEYKFPDDYDFVLDGKLRSPYFDRECNRPGATPQSIAQELERDYGGSEYQLFPPEVYEICKEHVVSPRRTYRIDADENGHMVVHDDPNGPFDIWHFTPQQRPEISNYVIGCDISSGLGGTHTSNSVAVVVDCIKKRQVAEFCSNTTRPLDFAVIVNALCKWYFDAFLIWETNGAPGADFTQAIFDLEYDNLYYRHPEQALVKKKTRTPGWRSTKKSKSPMLVDFAKAVISGELILVSDPLVQECRQYIYKNNDVVHSKSIKTIDDSASGEAHGDRVIAAGLAWEAMKDRPDQQIAKVVQLYDENNPPYGTLAWRELQYAKEDDEHRENEWFN